MLAGFGADHRRRRGRIGAFSRFSGGATDFSASGQGLSVKLSLASNGWTTSPKLLEEVF
jgi:hypothetical protein